MEKTINKQHHCWFVSVACFLFWLLLIASLYAYEAFFPGNNGTVLFANFANSSSFDFYKPPKPHDQHDDLPLDAESKSQSESCSGRYIYIHQLPSRFNTQILENCSALNLWFDMCPFLTNMGIGTRLEREKEKELFMVDSDSWYDTNQFTLGLIFHNRMRQYKCLTNDSSMASAIYVPFYAGLDIGRHLWGFNTSVRDSLSLQLADWLAEKPEWKRMWGRDHFFVAGRVCFDFIRQGDHASSWGNKLTNLPHVRNMTMLTIESTLFGDLNDTAIPYPTYFHPSTDAEVLNWQNKVKEFTRPHLFSFVGAPRPNQDYSIRSQIINQCLRANNNNNNTKNSTCRWLDCRRNYGSVCESPVEVMVTFLSSTFCLQPAGDSLTRRSIFDSILAGCIPVFFHEGSAYKQYIWHLPLPGNDNHNLSKYSVFIPERQVKDGKVNIEEELRGIPEEKVAELREEVVRLIPRITYANPMSRTTLDMTFQDAFDIAVQGVLDKVESVRRDMAIKAWS